MKKVLVFAIHPDDETLGCGGTLLKHKEQGDEIHWLIGTQIHESDGFSEERIVERNKEIKKVSEMYSFTSIHNLEIPTMRVDEYSMSELISKVSDIFKEIEPNIIYLPFKSDAHSDHRIFFEAAYSCTKVFRYPFIETIYMMETLSETDFSLSTKEDYFVPNTFVDISQYMDMKIDIMKVFESEIGDHPFPRSERNIKALATYRGATANCEYAESFMLLKTIIK